MEPSEQCAYDNDLNPPEDLPSDEERVIVEAPETLEICQEDLEQSQQVYSFSEVQESGDETLIELNGQHFVVERGSVDGEFYVLVPEGQVVTLECAIKEDEATEEDDDSHDGLPIANVDPDNTVDNPVEDHGDVKYLTVREVSNGVAYVQTPPDSFLSTTALPEEGIKNEKLMNLAAVAQEIQSADEHSATAEHIQDLKTQSLTEGSVIVSQIHADTDSVSMYPNSETEEDTATDLASEHDSKSGFCETSTDNLETEPTTMERRTSFSCISSTRTLDNTVSVIHTTSSTYIHEDIGKNVESSYVSNDYNGKLDMNVVESEQSEDSVPDLHENLSQDTCSNQNDKFSNQDEDSVLSQNCGLDLTKESNIVIPSCEDSLPAVEHTRSRYGIMDSLNKDKQTSYYDTNTSEDMEDTINSSSRSTNITEDGESVNGNNSNDLECNNIKEVVSELKLSPEKLSTEYENSNSKNNTVVMETCDKSSPVTYQDSETVQDTNNANEGLLSKRKQQSFCLPSNDNSNSNNCAFSDNVSTPSLLTKELNSVKIDLSPKQKAEVIDAYDFDDSSTEADNDSNPKTSFTCQGNNKEDLEEGTNSKNFEAEINANEDRSSQKLTFEDVLSKAANKEDSSRENCDTNFNRSTDLFHSSSEMEENGEICKSQEDISSNHESSIPEKENVINKNEYPERLNTEKVYDEPSSSKLNDVGKVNDVLCLMDTEECSVKPPQKTYIRTYIRKRKVNQDKIELFSCDDLSTAKDKETIFNIDMQKEKTSIWKDPSGEIAMDDDDIGSNVQSKVSTTYKRMKKSSPSEVQFQPLVFHPVDAVRPGDEVAMDEDDGIESNIQSKVSATYKRKQKSIPPVIRANRARSLRPRSSQTDESLENGTVDTSLCDLEGRLNSQEKSDSGDANWGSILLRTQFSSKPSSSEPLTEPSTSPNNSQPSRERKKPAYFMMANSKKSPIASGKQFDKLIKSSPTKVKDDTATYKKKKLRDKVKKQAMSLIPSPVKPSPSAHIHAKRGKPKVEITRVSNVKAPNSKNQKMSMIQYVSFACKTTGNENTVNENPIVSKEVDAPKNVGWKYSCDQCSFTSTRADNIRLHMKLCCNNLENHYNHREVLDPNKLQLLRGVGASANLDARDDKSKHKNKKIPSDHCNGSSADTLDQPGCSMSIGSKSSDKDKDDAIHAKEKFGFAKEDVVWIKRGRWHWPALVWDISDKETLLYVIGSTNSCESLKIASQSLEKRVHSFDDIVWSKRLLNNAKAMTNHSSFIKAVQKADSYVRKKFLDADFDAKTYFNIVETTKDNKPVNKKKPFFEVVATVTNSDALDIEKVVKCILEGNCNEHVVLLYHNKNISERHKLFEKDKDAKELEDMSWFGPFKTDSSMQLRLYDHFYDLYKKEIEGPANISYIYKVWIPEGIIKAISLVNRLSFKEAELIFLKQEYVDDIF